LIERAGFAAYSIGGFALVGSRYAVPDIGLAAYAEISSGVRDIMAATRLPVLVDGDTGYGDVKNVAHTIEGYEAMGASAIFIEDQVAPKRCGHMAGKDVIPAGQMVAKIRAAVGARRSNDFFIIARTDARAVHGLDEALRRGEQYLAAGADGIFIEAPQTVQELERVGRTFQGVPQIANMLEGGGQTPVLPPAELKQMGFAMAAYPTTLLFRATRTIERALLDIKAGRAIDSSDGVNFAEFKTITNYDEWARIEDTYRPTERGAA
jgi:2-methylisocitrate lyase-like PEP mutase family enzyme